MVRQALAEGKMLFCTVCSAETHHDHRPEPIRQWHGLLFSLIFHTDSTNFVLSSYQFFIDCSRKGKCCCVLWWCIVLCCGVILYDVF